MSPNPEEIRSFIAIELPDDVKNRLGKLKEKLERDEHKFVKWVDPAGIHLTLKFLGNISFKRVEEITDVMKQATQSIPPFRLEISGLGVFPNPKQMRVLWVGIDGELDKLMTLQARIDSMLATIGFAKEERPFVPHLTLARLREGTSPIQRRGFGEFVSSTVFEDKYPFRVESVSLMKSQLTPAGAIYSCLSLAKLGGGKM